MALTKKQQQLDEMKWKKSEELGADACGTFDFCEKCDKTLENPCDKAYRKFHEGKRAEKAAKKAEDAKKEEKASAPAKKKCTAKKA